MEKDLAVALPFKVSQNHGEVILNHAKIIQSQAELIVRHDTDWLGVIHDFLPKSALRRRSRIVEGMEIARVAIGISWFRIMPSEFQWKYAR
jgi:hypothetical protein